MKLHIVGHQVALFTFETQKEMALTMCRFQEFYESRNPEVKGIWLSFFDFVALHMDSEGAIDYFSTWEGFNFPGEVINHFLALAEDDSWFSPMEEALFSILLRTDPCADWVDDESRFYIIGCLEGDTETLDHEMAHAAYYVDANYRTEVEREMATWPTSVLSHFDTAMIRLGYANEVLSDERHAWILTGTPEQWLDLDVCIDPEIAAPYQERLRAAVSRFDFKWNLPS